MERPFVGGKSISTAFISASTCQAARSAGSHRAFARNALPLTRLIPTNVTWFRSCCTPQECEKLPGVRPRKRRKDRPKTDFFQLPYYGAPFGPGGGCYDGCDFDPSGRRASTSKRTLSSVNLHVSTYNIHKGFSQFNRRMMIH